MEEFRLREQSHRIRWLLDEADERGYLTYDQILETFSETKDDTAAFAAQLEQLFAYLYDHGIAVYDSQDEAMAANEEPGEDGDRGDAPDLTGYGSRQWTIAIIKDPAHKRFYGKDNDRMPAYAESQQEADNLLTGATSRY